MILIIFSKVSVNTPMGKRRMPKEATDTAETILFFDQLFDAMNGLCVKKNKKSLADHYFLKRVTI